MATRQRRWDLPLIEMNNAEEGERMMDVEDVARYLNLHMMTVYRMLQSGVLPARKVGGRWRVNKKELDEWLENYTGGSRKLVLVVDDDPAIGRLFKRALQHERCTVDVVQRGEDAVKRIKERDYDLIFLDLVLPDMDGAKTFAQIRKIDPEAHVVLMTGYPDSELVGEAMKHGAISLLIKPVPIGEIRRLVRNFKKRLPRQAFQKIKG
ncbi:Regulatory protein LuxO [bacterium HR17]|jgi:excisionase family DNA binding protein|uniref:Regulatory protein LuxO n=1 Tax=Candidatus Fervidibacter japonicus TaxID=2035412 RepID=A0A2H5XB25_9BACT|nr:Regulatory protein LuxO [bacterium HR17]